MPPVGVDQLEFVGQDLHRPECVLCASDGRLAVSDWRGGVMLIDGRGRQRLIAGPQWLRPNGIALRPDGSFYVTHLDDAAGGVFVLEPNGELRPELLEVEGAPLPPTNFVLPDADGRLWITVSTRLVPRTLARRPDYADGIIVLKDERGARVVADGLGFTNEVRLDPQRRHLYVAETWGRRLSRFVVGDTGRLTDRETFLEFGVGTYPDGIAFDESGAIWVTSVFSNRVLRVLPDRSVELWCNGEDADFVAELEDKRASGALAGPTSIQVPPSPLGNVSSIAFGGPDRRTAYLGCLLNGRLATFRAPVAGAEPVHWRWRMPCFGNSASSRMGEGPGVV